MSNHHISWKQFRYAVITIALPIAFQNLLITTASMVDTIMIGSQGELAVAAVGICAEISMLFFACYNGFSSGALLFFSQYWGADEEKGMNRAFGITFLFMFAVAMAFALVAITNPAFILGIYTDKQEIIEVAVPYVRIIGFAYPVQAIGVLISFFMRATERVKAPLISSIIGLVVNFVLNYLLICGRFGAPKMGPAGAAVGTLASAIVNLTILCVVLSKSKCRVRLRMKELFVWDWSFVQIYLKKCFPIICNEVLYGVGQMLINMVIGRQAAPAIAAMAAFRVIEGFVYAFFGGLADASSVVVGKEVGAGSHMNGYQYMKGFTLLCPAITFGICLTAFVLYKPLLGLFGLGEVALFYGKYMLLIYLAAGAIRTCNYIMNICFRAGGESLFGTVLEIGCLFLISVPATWIAGMILKLPFLAVFSFVYTDELIRLVVELRYARTGKWIKPVTESGKETVEEFRRQMAAKRQRQ